VTRVLWFLVAAAITIAVAWWVAGLPGHVAASLAGYTVETSTPVALVGLVVVVAVAYLLLRLLALLITLPRRNRRWRERRRRMAGDRAVSRTLLALAAGDEGDARRESRRARGLLGDTPQTLLLAAEACRLAGDDGEAAAIYKLMAEREDAAFIGLRGLFRQAMAREEWNTATALAARAEAVHPGGAWLKEERSLLAVRTGNWQQALLLAGPGAPTAAYATAASDAAADPAEAIRLARRAWRNNPAFTPAALAYARRLREAGRERTAQGVIRQSWQAAPNPELAAFALANITDPWARVKAAGRLAEANPDHPESHFLLARANLDAGLSGEARHHAEAARRNGLNQRRLYLLLADLEAEEKPESEEARQAHREAQHEALRAAASADPDPGWRCEVCGTPQSGWLPACPACHTAGRIAWGGPARLALTAG
jgi:HemY protein